MKVSRFFLVFGVVCLVANSTAWTAQIPSTAGKLPENWYRLPEDRTASLLDVFSQTMNTVPREVPSEELGNTVSGLFDVNQRVLDRIHPLQSNATPANGHPKDWVPWHFEIFTTDLAVSAQGLIGLSTFKGTPAVQVYWRKQGNAPTSSTPATPSAPVSEPLVVQVNPDQASEQAVELEPAIRGALATGKIQNEAAFRENAKEARNEFMALLQALDTPSHSQWWASGLRLDFQVSGSGKMLPTFSTVGGDLRLRFEWKRLKRTQPLPPAMAPVAVNQNLPVVLENLKKFIMNMETDIEQALADQSKDATGFQPHTVRIGVGVSAKGTVGVAKGAVSALGHVLFSRDISKPVVYPVTQALELSQVQEDSTVMILESAPSEAHLNYAKTLALPVQTEKSASFLDGERIGQAIYKVGRERFREGLAKASRMGMFFADRSKGTNGPGWKIFQLKSSFDISVSGDFGFTGFGVLGSLEIAFWNKDF